LAEDFTFSSPPDPNLDRAEYFERCWPNSKAIKAFRFQKIIEDDGEVLSRRNLRRRMVSGDAIPSSSSSTATRSRSAMCTLAPRSEHGLPAVGR
jgi:hypothetical protein